MRRIGRIFVAVAALACLAPATTSALPGPIDPPVALPRIADLDLPVCTTDSWMGTVATRCVAGPAECTETLGGGSYDGWSESYTCTAGEVTAGCEESYTGSSRGISESYSCSVADVAAGCRKATGYGDWDQDYCAVTAGSTTCKVDFRKTLLGLPEACRP